jgi:hypothetical protein
LKKDKEKLQKEAELLKKLQKRRTNRPEKKKVKYMNNDMSTIFNGGDFSSIKPKRNNRTTMHLKKKRHSPERYFEY